MGTRLTIDQLEKMKTHELADMLASVVLLLRRMPDVECKQLVRHVPDIQVVEPPPFEPVATMRSSFTRAELEKMKVAELKALADKLNVLYAAKDAKPKLIEKILAKPLDGHSEQRAIQDR
jgi:hypothetical protein